MSAERPAAYDSKSGGGGSKETDAKDPARGASPLGDTGSESRVRVPAPASSAASTLTVEQREWLRSEIDRRRRMIACEGCGTLIDRTSDRRRYCTRACANRHWHVRRKIDNPEYRHAR